jgi:hypothetical protein
MVLTPCPPVSDSSASSRHHRRRVARRCARSRVGEAGPSTFTFTFTFPLPSVHSYRSDTIGSSSAALRAGHIPKKMPTAAEKANARPTAVGEMEMFQPAMFCTV